MTRRTSVPYGEREVRPVYVPGQMPIMEPVAGFYFFKLGRNTIRGVVKLWYGQPADPVTGELMDRSLRWQSLFNDEPIDIDRVFPACVGEPATEVDYRAACERLAWARQHAPNSSYAKPSMRHDLLSTAEPMPF